MILILLKLYKSYIIRNPILFINISYKDVYVMLFITIKTDDEFF